MTASSSLLLGDPDPALRLRAATELLGADGTDAEVRAWRAEVERRDDVRGLVAQLAAAAPARPQEAGYLLCRLVHLGHAGSALGEAVDAIFGHQQADGSWPVWPPDAAAAGTAAAGPKKGRRRGQAPAALPAAESYRMITMQTALPLRGIAAAGFATDPRAERAYDWLVAQRLSDGSWTGSHKADLGLDGRSSGEDPEYRRLRPGDGCRSATTGAVACFALHPQRSRSDVARTGVAHLLAQPIRRDAAIGWEVARLVGLERAGGRFTFYVTHDLAFVLDLASRCGVVDDDLVAYLEARRGPFGLWEHPVHPQLSRWLTFELASSFRRLGISSD